MTNLLTIIGFGAPIIGYFYLLSRYSINVIVGDQWDDLTVIKLSYVHLFDWGSLWALHNENRLFFPNLIVILLSRTVHFNIQIEEYLSGVMLLASTFLLIWAHKRRSASSPWLYYVPVPVLMLSVVQWQNTLWGFQMAWYLVLLSLAATLVLLDLRTLGWLTFGVAILVGIVGSFSSLQGLIIWPAGLILIYHRRRPWPFVAVWIAAGVGSVVLYFHNFSNAAGQFPNWAWQHPLVAIRFYVALVGDVVGVPMAGSSPNYAVMGFGTLIVVVAIVTVLMYGIRRDERSGSPVGVALICFGLLFAATVTQGRIIFGNSSSSQSRYTTFDLLILVGIYLTLLGRPQLGRAAQPSSSVPTTGLVSLLGRTMAAAYSRAQQIWLNVARWVVIGAILVQLVAGLVNGLPAAKGNYEYKAAGAKVLRNINHSSNSEVQYYLYIFESPAWIRSQARIAQEHHLSVFDDSGSSNRR